MAIQDYIDKHKRKDYYRGSMKQTGFITGTGRCGSTLLAQVLNAHSNICVPHELQIIVSIDNGDRLFDIFRSGRSKRYQAIDFIELIARCCPYHFRQFFDYPSHFNDLSYPQNNLTELLTGLFDHICYTYGKEIFIEQTPWYGRKLDELLEIFPDMKLIHLVRDGRDVAISYARTPWWAEDIGANLEQWACEVEHIASYRNRLGSRFVEIRYEDMVSNPESELTRILNLFGRKLQPEMLLPRNLIDYSKMFKDKGLDFTSESQKKWESRPSEVNNNEIFFKSSLYSWKKYKAFDFSSMSPKVARTLLKFGYEI